MVDSITWWFWWSHDLILNWWNLQVVFSLLHLKHDGSSKLIHSFRSRIFLEIIKMFRWFSSARDCIQSVLKPCRTFQEIENVREQTANMFGIIKWFFSYDTFTSKFIPIKSQKRTLKKITSFCIFCLAATKVLFFGLRCSWEILTEVGKFLITSNFIENFPTSGFPT